MAHVNLTGKHVSIWLTSKAESIDWGTSAEFPNEEAAFFGNVFAAKPEAYICHGHEMGVNPIRGRVCDGQADCPYVNPYAGAGGTCSAPHACRAHQTLHQTDGYSECRTGEKKWTRVITTWKP
jgi:hypothetical protein